MIGRQKEGVSQWEELLWIVGFIITQKEHIIYGLDSSNK